MLSLLKNLVQRRSPSGEELEMTNYIIREISPYAECKVDKMGNLIALKKGVSGSKKKIMICAHMDEVAFMITAITEEGFLKFSPVGGILVSAMLGKRVKVSGKVGVIGVKAVHLCSNEEKEALPKAEDLYIDIGAKDKTDAEGFVKAGDYATFDSEIENFGDAMLKSQALDDKVGVAIMVDIIRTAILLHDTYFVFTVQEEVGCRGAKTAAFQVDPDIALVIESTTAGDIAETEEINKVCKVGGGAVLSFMDNGTVYHKKLLNRLISIANEHGIRHQLKTAVAGGNDASVIHLSNGGVKTAVISLPCRYIHSPSSIGSINDMRQMRKLVEVSLNELQISDV